MKPVSRTWVWRFAQPPEPVWELLADTKRFNEAAGIARHDITETANDDGSVTYKARLPVGPFVLRWEERPLEWVRPQRFIHCRVFANGPFRSLCASAALTAENGGCRVAYRLDVVPAGWLGSLILAAGFMRRVGRTFTALADDVRAYLDGRGDRPYPAVPLRLDEGARARLDAMIAQIEATAFGHGLAPRLADHIALGQEADLLRMRPLELARRWNVEPRAVVECMLQATKAGMLDLHWDLLCPNCRGAKASVATLDALPTGAHCPSCNIDYGRDFAANVEITFRPAAAVRDLPGGEFCLFGPMTTPHVVVQQTLAPGEARQVAARLAPGAYRLRTLHPGGEATVEHDSAAFPETVFDGSGVSTGSPSPMGHVRLINRASREATLLIEERAWVRDALTAHRLTTSQAFRDLFAAEALRPGDEVAIATVALLFTDLEGSTALYSRVGDAPAYGLVRAHFGYLAQAIREHDGAIVKTIGDSVMAAFTRPVDAAGAALAIRRNVAALNASHDRARLVIKIGVHVGPCIAVTLNDRLDYFGSTVNMAARLQGHCRGGEIVLSRALAGDPELARLIADRPIIEDSALFKGFDERVRFYRLPAEPECATQEVGGMP
ncbi:MAG: adenylate/guanylate cyclase domain-containing protein [Alphaproteobacteria bacterium]